MLLAAFPALVLLLVGGLAWFAYMERREMPDLETFVRFEPPTTGAVYDTQGEVLVELAREYREIVSYEEIPVVVRHAVLAAEDKNFFSHSGIDYAAFPRVALRNLRSLAGALRRAIVDGDEFAVSFVQGGSTITQQLVRGYFLPHLTRRENGAALLDDGYPARICALLIGTSATNKLLRKAEEIRIAFWLEEEMAERLGSRQEAKEMIFARYASFIYLGHGRYGFAAASRYYFDKPLADYTADDADKAALLAAIIKNPGAYAPTTANAERALRRRNDTLALMTKNGFLSAEEARRWQSEPIQLAARPEVPNDAPAVIAHALEELRQGTGGFATDDLVLGRVRVHTTVDGRMQRIANNALENGLRLYEQRHPKYAGATQGAVVVLRNADASILAEVGGRRFYNGRHQRYSDYNRAIQSLRQPGSALKPLVYLAAFRQGATLDTTVLDEPIAVPTTVKVGWKPIANYDSTFKGEITIRQALAESRNAATIWTAREIGIEPVLQTARDLGMRTPLQPYLSTALGASEVTLLELANVYRALASGVVARPHVIDRLTNADGEVLYRVRELGRRLALPELPLIQEGLRGVLRLPGGTGRALNGRGFPIQVIGKTGTSNDFRDALFVGSTYGQSGITVAVWVGHDDHRPLGNKETGGRTALPIFREVMLNIYQQGLAGRAPELPRAIDRGIDTYLAEEAVMMAEREEPAFERAVDRWPSQAMANPARAAREGSRAVVQFVRSWYDRLPVLGGGNADRPRPSPPEKAPPVTWTCSQTAAGVDCVARSVPPRIAVRERPDRRPFGGPRL